MNAITDYSLEDIKRDVIKGNRECSQRGLVQSAKWAAEINYCLDEVSLTVTTLPGTINEEVTVEYDQLLQAKSYFDVKEYDRAAHFLQNCKSPLSYFICVFSKYLAGEKQRLDNCPDHDNMNDSLHTLHLRELRAELQKKHADKKLDGYALYLYGVVLKKLGLVDDARALLVEAVKSEPLNWSAWAELALIVTNKDMLHSLALPEHWIRLFFVAHASLELQLNEAALELFTTLRDHGFSKSTYVLSQIAMSNHNLQKVDEAIAGFADLQEKDPCRLDHVDSYSNLLYVKEMRIELARLAHKCCQVNKFREETCAVIGNYYSFRGEHEKALLYFQRALKLNPNYLSAWTLIGYEYMELKNTNAAIRAYRSAIEVNKHDYRALYGLGQAYEILKMPLYSLYYHRQAQVLRPNDSRMLVAMGDGYEKLERLQEAKKCYYRAHCVGDMEGLALCKLAKVFERLGEQDQAAGAYAEFLAGVEQQGLVSHSSLDDVSSAYIYLSYYYLRHSRLDEAYYTAQKSIEFSETREEGKCLLKQISELRSRTGSEENTSVGGGPPTDFTPA